MSNTTREAIGNLAVDTFERWFDEHPNPGPSERQRIALLLCALGGGGVHEVQKPHHNGFTIVQRVPAEAVQLYRAGVLNLIDHSTDDCRIKLHRSAPQQPSWEEFVNSAKACGLEILVAVRPIPMEKQS